VTIFLSILSGALIALALVAQADHFGPIFISIATPTSPYDDLCGALQTPGIDAVSAPKRLGSVIHIPQTLPAILGVIVAAVGGAIVALIALASGIPPLAIGLVAAAAFVLILVLMGTWNRRGIKNSEPSLAS
jgi:hypothetical protein